MQFSPVRFQAKNTHYTEFPERKEEDTAFSTILQHYKDIQVQLKDIQNALQHLHTIYKYNSKLQK